ncbi:uncharacterized protein [Apostichopus japonicus]
MNDGASDPGLFIRDTIQVLTPSGDCKIEYYLGDICKLKAKHKVDVLLVSAFADNYKPTPKSFIGALSNSLGLSVEELAENKAEDLRTYYSCWVSKPLSKHLPFNRLLCFEPNWSVSPHPKVLVGDIFRCLVPVLQKERGTVITPILTSGSQGFAEAEIVYAMVEAAVKWMKVGLPLKCLKIVQYAIFNNGKQIATHLREYEAVQKVFEELKERYDMQYLLPKATLKEYDVYISGSKDDAEVSARIQDELRRVFPKIRIKVGSDQKMMEGESWQDDMYNTMMKSSRVITVLSPKYLQDAACIEQYNIALCCNRRAHKDLLAPFYAENVPDLPSYMQLVQYVDCRNNSSNQISEGCKNLARSISTSAANIHSDIHWMTLNPVKYDVFLSYSHADTTKANQLRECLQKEDPNLRLFFDIQEIKQGKAWQRLLYHSIDGTTVFVAMVSERYLQSAVCNEEYRLALAKLWSEGDPLKLLVLKIEDIRDLPREYTDATTVSAVDDFSDKIKTLSHDIVKCLHDKHPSKKSKIKFHKTKANIDVAKGKTLNLDKEASKLRRLCFKKRFPDYKLVIEKGLQVSLKDQTQQETRCHIAISFDKLDQKYASYIQSNLQQLAPHLNVKMTCGDNKVRLAAMETADRIVALLSPNYLESPEQVEEFHVAIYRQRMANKSLPILYPIQLHALPPKPTYFRIVPYVVSVEDELWQEVCQTMPDTVLSSKLYDLKFRRTEKIALDVVISDLISLAEKQSNYKENQTLKPQPSLINISEVMSEISLKNRNQSKGHLSGD